MTTWKGKTKRLLALLVSFSMVLSLLSLNAFAAEGEMEAAVNGTECKTLAEAIGMAKEGDTVTLLQDVTLTSQITVGRSIALDLDGRTLSGEGNGQIKLLAQNSLTIYNGFLAGKGTVILSEGNLTLSKVKTGSPSSFSLRLNMGSATIDDCALQQGNGGSTLLVIGNAQVSVSGSYLNSADNYVAQISGSSGALTVYRSTLLGDKRPAVWISSSGGNAQVILNDGAQVGTGSTGTVAAIDADNGTVEVSEGASLLSAINPIKGMGKVVIPGGGTLQMSDSDTWTVNPCEHVWGNQTLVKVATCTEDGQWGYTCSICNHSKTETIPALQHRWGEWVIQTQTSCEQDGVQTRTCTRDLGGGKICGEEETQTTEAPGHNFGEWKVTKAATCTAEGEETHTCTVCSTSETRTIPADNAHTFGEWTTTKEPACTEAGTETRTCSACGETETKEIPATGHQVVTEWSADDSNHWHVCGNCGERMEEATHTENEGVVTQAATATTAGVRTFSCTVCGHELRTETIPATGGGSQPTNPSTPSTPSTPSNPVIPPVDPGNSGNSGGTTGGPGISDGPTGGTNTGTGDEDLTDPSTPTTGEPGQGEEDLGESDTPLESKPFLFTDVADGRWYYPAVKYVFDRGLMSGVTDTLFDPFTSTSRGMMATVLYRLEGAEPLSAAEAEEFLFADVDMTKTKWYTDPVLWAASKGIVTGYDNGSFGPNDNVTREQVAAILYRYANFKGMDTSVRADLSGYTDANRVARYARDAMAWAVGTGIIGGIDTITLAPKGNASRVQIATMFMRFDKLLAESESSEKEPETEAVG